MKELKYYGIHACLKLWEKRPHDLIRVYIDPSHVKEFGPLLKWCAENKKAYHIVPDEDLSRVSDSVHHEGICMLARELPVVTEQAFLAAMEKKQERICLLYLDGVQNPHNLGSILRTAAHFGIPYVLGQQGKLPAISPSAARVAKGGAEIVRLVPLASPLKTLNILKQKGFSFIGTSSHEGTSLYQFKFPAKSIIALGSESHGISKQFLNASSNKIEIPGSGAVESLNVAIATGLCIGEYCRQHK